MHRKEIAKNMLSLAFRIEDVAESYAKLGINETVNALEMATMVRFLRRWADELRGKQ